MDYAFVHEGKAYGPSGIIKDVEGTPLEAQDAGEYNKTLEAQEIAWLKSGPEKVMLYVRHPEQEAWSITTWLGTVVSDGAVFGQRQVTGFQGYYRGGSYRRSVTCRIFDVKYHGWFYESSGDYCRLKRAKVQK